MPGLMTFLGMDSSGFNAGLNKAQAQAASAGKRIGSSLAGGAGQLLSAFAPAISVAAVAGASKAVLDYAGMIQDLSERTGISTDALQEWDYAMKQTGGSIETAIPFFEKLAVAKRDAMAGTSAAVLAFQKFGISVKDLGSMGVEEIGTKVADAVKSGDVEQLIPYLRDIGGKSAGEMIQAFRTGIGGLRDEAREIGSIIDAEAIAKMDTFNDKIVEVWARLKAGLAVIVTPIVDLITTLLNKVEEVGAFIGGFMGSGSINGGLDAVADLKKTKEARAAAAAERGGRGAGFGIGDGATKEAEKSAKELTSLEKQLADVRYKNWYSQLTQEQKIAVQKKKAQLANPYNILEQDPAKRLAMMIEGETAKGELANLMKPEKKEKLAKENIGIDSLQASGAYVRGDSPMMTPLQQSERHLRELLSIAKTKNSTISGF